MKVAQFTFGDVESGPFQGRRKVVFKHGNSDKSSKLSLSNPAKRNANDDDGDQDIVSDPDDPLCTVMLLEHHINVNLPVNWQGLMFLYQAPQYVLQARTQTKEYWIANTEPKCPTTDATPKGKVGRNFLCKKTKILAQRCKFTNWQKFTGRSCRKTGISKMAAAGVATGEMCGAARHKNVRVNVIYQTRNAETAAQRHAAFHVPKKVVSHKEV